MMLRQGLLWTVVGLGLAAAGSFLLGIFEPFGWYFFDDLAGDLFALALIVGGCFAVSWVHGRGQYRWLMVVGLISGLVVAGGCIPFMLENVWYLNVLPKWAEITVGPTLLTLVLVLIIAAHWGLTSVLGLERRGWRRLRTVARYALFAPVIHAALMIWWWDWMSRLIEWWLTAPDQVDFWDLEGPLLTGLVIMELCLTGLLPFGAILEAWRRRAEQRQLVHVTYARLQCPTCETSLTLKDGEGWCGQCGLHVRLHIEAPRCACGYMMFHTKGTTCPECGEELPFRRDAVRADTFNPPPPEGD